MSDERHVALPQLSAVPGIPGRATCEDLAAAVAAKLRLTPSGYGLRPATVRLLVDLAVEVQMATWDSPIAVEPRSDEVAKRVCEIRDPVDVAACCLDLGMAGTHLEDGGRLVDVLGRLRGPLRRRVREHAAVLLRYAKAAGIVELD